MSGHPGSTLRDIGHNSFNDHTRINLGDVHNYVHYSSPRPVPHAGVVHVIPYPRNEDLVHRQDLMKRLDGLLPSTPESCSVALWGLGGSGKTQIALNYAYRRCDTDQECCVFWVHADSEATFSADYKTIGEKLGVDDQLNGSRLLDAVRAAIEARPRWLMIIDNADDLRLFGVGQQAKAEEENDQQNQNLRGYIPVAPQGIILWTSRDGHIAGTLVGSRRAIEVRSMAMDEARKLLAGILDTPSAASETSRDISADFLLEELQYLPLAISQAGAYMKRLTITAEEYLAHLNQGKTRWEVLKQSDSDRHRRPEVSNSVLETWKISTERIRNESELSYHILHVIAYVNNQDISQELLMSAACSYAIGSEDHEDDAGSTTQVPELKVLQAVARLEEFSFLNLRRTDNGERHYEMHKLVQEAVRYDLMIRSLNKTLDRVCDGSKNVEAFYSRKALQVLRGIMREQTSWVQREKYVTHAMRVEEWAEVSNTEVETAFLLDDVVFFLHHQGRWREIGPLAERGLSLRKKVLGEKHPDTLMAMSDLASDYSGQCQHDKAQGIYQEVLEIQRQVLAEENPETLVSMGRIGSSLFIKTNMSKQKCYRTRY
ncbi:hypothetical protein FSPOR_9950 [Fusarium sporotrichioides]|uniref:Uncharacterized protein n=1 Tax=Fusarium sporotrichioides TaxID=5514 RepID=A0A395RNJ2_FUSSP|nr:hypothetical protein FSPOR_9950 [Fusarium sporotrichioides]